MANLILCFPNRAETATVSGGSWTGLSNIQDRNSYTIARSANATTASTQFDLDVGTTDYSLKALSLHQHNLSINATWRVTVGTSAGASDVYDSGFISVWQIAFDSDLNEFEQGAYWSDVVNDSNARSHFSIISTFGNTPRSNQFIRVEINDTSNTAGYIEIGNVFLGSGFQPTYNASWGLQHGWNDKNSVINYAVSGEMNYEKYRAPRTANFTLDWVSDSEGNTLYELMRRAGKTGEVMYIPDPADMAYTQRYGFRGTMRQLGALEKTSLNVNTKEFQLEELI